MATESAPISEKRQFDGGRVNILSGVEGGRFSVEGLIKDPEEFKRAHGTFMVDHLVNFGRLFEVLIGRYDGQSLGAWDRENPETLVDRGIIVMEYFYDEARVIMQEINSLAQRVIQDPALYDDPQFCADYLALARAGYDFLRNALPEFRAPLNPRLPIITLERGGLVSARLGLGVDLEAVLQQEVSIATKRVHPKSGQETELAATVRWRDPEKLSLLDGSEANLFDFVNPASGASTAAAVIAMMQRGISPQAIHQYGISMTPQGALFAQDSLGALGIETTFASLGESSVLGPNYYLGGGRAVGDAGRALRRSLPSWYTKPTDE